MPIGDEVPPALLDFIQPLAPWFYVVDLVAWGLIGVALSWELVRGRRRWIGDLPWIGAVWAVAFVVRWMVTPGPQEVNDRAHFAMVRMADVTWLYGVGVPSWGRVVFGLAGGPTSDEHLLFHANALTDSLTAVLMITWARLMGASRAAACGVGMAMALATPLVGFAHTDMPTVPETFLTFASLVLAALHAERPSWLRGLAAGAALSVAAQMRPESAAIVPFVVALMVSGPHAWPWRSAGTWMGAAWLGLIGVSHGVAQVLMQARGGVQWLGPFHDGRFEHPLVVYGLRHLMFFDPTYVFPTTLLFAVVGLRYASVPTATRVWLAVSAVALALLVMTPYYTPIYGVWPVFARFQLRAMPFFFALAGLGVGTCVAWTRDRVASAMCAAVFVGGLAWNLPFNFEERIHTQEYGFFWSGMRWLEPGCVLSAYRHEYDAGFSPDTHQAPVVARGATLQSLEHEDPSSKCHVYYRAANCVVMDMAVWLNGPRTIDDRCVAWEEQHVLVPLSETTLTGRPFGMEHFDGPVRVGFYRVVGRSERPSTPPDGSP